MWRIKNCKAVAGEHVTIQHKPAVFVVYLKKRREVKSWDRKMIKLEKCRDNATKEYKERMWDRYEELSEEPEGVERGV